MGTGIAGAANATRCDCDTTLYLYTVYSQYLSAQARLHIVNFRNLLTTQNATLHSTN
jgi:hypothetical protein